MKTYMDGFVTGFLLGFWVMAFVLLFVINKGQNRTIEMYNTYCQSLNLGEYQMIDDINYCYNVEDNTLSPIEWLND